MKRSMVASAVAVCFFSGFAGPSVNGEDSQDVQAILEQEASGASVDRRTALGSQPVDDSAGWQAGLIKAKDGWMSIEQLSSDPATEEYHSKRAQFSDHPHRHLIMAHWSVRNRLPDRARAHYFGVLSSAPDHRESREYLGHILVDGTWVDRQELAAARSAFQRSLEQLEQWTPKLKTIVQDIRSGNTKKMTAAFRDLDDLDPIAALPALEFFAANIDDDLATPLIRKIAQVRSPAACAALVRVGLAHPSGPVRQQTSDIIRTYQEDYFVPQLLGMLAGEVQISGNLVMRPNGNIGLETVVKSELQNRNQQHRVQKLVNVVAIFSSQHSMDLKTTTQGDVSYWSNFWNVPTSDPVSVGTLRSGKQSALAASREQQVYVPRNLALTAAQNLHEQGKQQERAVAQQNRVLKQRVNNVCSLLRSTTDADLEDQAELWWNWWNDYSERYEATKPTASSYQWQKQRLAVASRAYSTSRVENAYDFGKMLIQYSCLVPGTLVQTESGLIPIEQIQIGDMVLSQDVETAELALKPVILTTLRPPKSTIKIVTEQETIEATGGHNWWVSGKGWLKTRDLKPDMLLHTARGTTTIRDLIYDPEPQKTYNLVVDEFHTYFVGPQRVLSYDNTLLKPTARQVPGYELLADAAL